MVIDYRYHGKERDSAVDTLTKPLDHGRGAFDEPQLPFHRGGEMNSFRRSGYSWRQENHRCRDSSVRSRVKERRLRRFIPL
jgi:hypothetical protein